MIDKVKELLRSNGFEFEEDGDAIIIECCGCDYDFIRLISLINDNVEEWTYEDMIIKKVEIDCSFETVKIFY